jgi:hypothetical protein
MSENEKSSGDTVFPQPEGAPKCAFFDGILEGPCAEPQTVRVIAARINAAGYGRTHLDIEGPRFTLVMEAEPAPPESMTDHVRQAFASALQELLDSLPDRGNVESTLRCMEVYSQDVVEIMFGVSGRKLRVVGRIRPAGPDDLARQVQPAAAYPAFHMGARRIAAIGILVAVLFGLIAWRSGYLGRLFSPAGSAISLDTGPFGDMLHISIEKSWGRYKVAVTRGPSYPKTVSEANALRSAGTSTAQAAAVNVVADGGDVYVRLENAQRQVLVSNKASLRPLLVDSAGSVETRLPGRMSGTAIRLALEPGKSIESDDE